ncbi:hypothetical protein [Streptomyces nigrescens]|uniref:hypothetical protein n=1 Tax=Streptomyces nigrescens TaxID=1920 RepID=UPI003700135E
MTCATFWPAPCGYDDEEFATYVLTHDAIIALRNWAHRWAGDLDERLARETDEYEG